MRYKVHVSARAIRDLESSRDYLAQHAPETVEQWYSAILDSLNTLENDPHRWSLAPESARFPFELRQLMIRSKSRKANRALFVVLGDQVRVLAVRRPGQPLVTQRDIE